MINKDKSLDIYVKQEMRVRTALIWQMAGRSADFSERGAKLRLMQNKRNSLNSWASLLSFPNL
jgi:hypothetical protein